MIKTFNDFDLPELILANIQKLGYLQPTQIQCEAIPCILENKDLLASSQTGSGKTAAFAIPIISKIAQMPRDENKRKIKALILAPTRELAIQIKECFTSIRGDSFYMNIAVIFGGSDMKRQIDMLKKGCDIIIATPGRLMDHLSRKTVRESDFAEKVFFVLDEFDRMLDMGFSKDVDAIINFVPVEKQMIMFSATIRDSVIKVASKYLKNEYEEIEVASQKTSHEHIVQDFRHVDHRDKYKYLQEELKAEEGLIIVFVNMKRIADELCESLREDGHEAKAIHGDLRQKRREFAIRDFKSQKIRILIATDVAARGLDIPNVALVINFDVPNNLEGYTHRIGRTGRAGASGHAVSFLTNKEKHMHDIFVQKKDSDEIPPQPHRKGSARFGDRGGRFSAGARGSNGFGNQSFGGDARGGERQFSSRGNFSRDFNAKGEGASTGRSFGGSSSASDRRFGGKRMSFGDRKPKRF